MSFGSFNNKKNPVVQGINEGMQNATPRLSVLSTPVANYPTQNQTTSSNSNSNLSNGIDSLVKGGLSLMNGLGSIRTDGADTGSGGVISENIDGYANGNDTNSLGGSIFSNAGDLYNLYSSISSNGSSGSGLFSGGSSGGSGIGAYGGLISGGINGLSSFAQSGDYKDGLQGMFGVDDENQSEIMQAISGAKNGAMMGSSFGPWGAAIGGVLGLGSSFLDDI